MIQTIENAERTIAATEKEMEKARNAAERMGLDTVSLRRSDWWMDRARQIAAIEMWLMSN